MATRRVRSRRVLGPALAALLALLAPAALYTALSAAALLSIPPIQLAAQRPGAPVVVDRPGFPAADGSAADASQVLRGRVVSADAGFPLPGVVVAVSSAEGGVSPLRTVTDMAGRFELSPLSPGQYLLTVRHQRYLPYTLRQALTEAAAEDVEIRMTRASAIEGRVVDELGEPVSGARVSVHRVEETDGRLQVTFAGSSCGSGPCSTDDRGHFRLFGLAPGEYLVSAELPPALAIAVPPGGHAESQEGYARSFYPGTSEAEAGQRVAVAAGADAIGLTLTLVPARLATVAGRLVHADGTPASGTGRFIEVLSMSPLGFTAATGYLNRDGTFSIPGLPAGAYRIDVRTFDADSTEFASAVVVVDGTSITDLTLPLTSGRAARGRVIADTGEPPLDLLPGQLRVRASGMNIQFVPPPPPTVNDDWTFEVRGITGERRLVVDAPRPWQLLRVMRNGVDVTDTPLDFSRDIDGLTLVLTSRATDVSGNVFDRRGERVEEYVVVIFAEDRSRWTPELRYVGRSGPDPSGRYRVQGLPPGRYIAVALDALDPGEERNAGQLERLRSMGIQFSLDQHEARVLDLRLSTGR